MLLDFVVLMYTKTVLYGMFCFIKNELDLKCARDIELESTIWMDFIPVMNIRQ